MKDLRVKKTMHALGNALWKILSEKSMETISVNELCRTAEVGRATFYKHFSDKYDLFEFLIQRIKTEVIERELSKKQNLTIFDLYKNLIEVVFGYLDKNRKTFAQMILHNDDEMVRLLFVGITVKELKQQLESNKQHFQIPTDVIAHYYVGGLTTLAMWWIQTPNNYTKQDMTRFATSLIGANFAI